MKNAIKKEAAVQQNKKKNAAAHAMLKKFMALPFLPHEMVKDAFEYLKEDCKRDFGNVFNKFIDYFEKEWIKVVTPKGFSIYRLKHATNNFLESYHRVITELMGKRPTPCNFLSKILGFIIILCKLNCY